MLNVREIYSETKSLSSEKNADPRMRSNLLELLDDIGLRLVCCLAVIHTHNSVHVLHSKLI